MNQAVPTEGLPRNRAWAHGRKHIFLSEGARQLLERLREERRAKAAAAIQGAWRRWRARRKAVALQQQVPKQQQQQMFQRGVVQQQQQQQHLRSSMQHRPRPQPIMGTPPPMMAAQTDPKMMMQVDRCDFKTIQQTCALFGLDLVGYF